MDGFVRSLSPRAEFLIVIGVALGWPILGSVLAAISPEPPQPITAGALDSILVYESLVLMLLAPFLRQRDWTTGRLGLTFSTRDLFAGLALALLTEFLFVGLTQAATAAGVPQAQTVPIAQGIGLGRAALVSLVNGAFEEIFVCGYVLGALAGRRSAWFAINLSTAIRLSYHLYQGGPGVLGAVPMGLLCAGWYARTGRLWPVILAHAALDFVAFAIPT